MLPATRGITPCVLKAGSGWCTAVHPVHHSSPLGDFLEQLVPPEILLGRLVVFCGEILKSLVGRMSCNSYSFGVKVLISFLYSFLCIPLTLG